MIDNFTNNGCTCRFQKMKNKYLRTGPLVKKMFGLISENLIVKKVNCLVQGGNVVYLPQQSNAQIV